MDVVTSMLMSNTGCSYAVLGQEEYTQLATIYDSQLEYAPQWVPGEPTVIFCSLGPAKRVIYWLSREAFLADEAQAILGFIRWL